MPSPEVCRSFLSTPLASSDFWMESAERFDDASASDTEEAVATTERSSRRVSGVPATFARPPTVMPGPPITGAVADRVAGERREEAGDNEVLVPMKVEAVAGAPPERAAPMT